MHSHTHAHVCIFSRTIPTCTTLPLGSKNLGQCGCHLEPERLQNCLPQVHVLFLCLMEALMRRRGRKEGGGGGGGGGGSDPESPKLLNFPK